nr:hypothetical protein [uncultured Ligilactobacillus sp.]
MLNINNIILWNGTPGTLNKVNQSNFSYIQSLVDKINKKAEIDLNFNSYDINFDLQLLPYLNRNARIQFLDNAKLLNKYLFNMVDDFESKLGIVDYDYKVPSIPTILFFDKDLINNYWTAIKNDVQYIADALDKLIGDE